MKSSFVFVFIISFCHIASAQHQVTTYCQKCEDFDGSAFILHEPSGGEAESDCDGDIPSEAKRICYGSNDYNWLDYYRAQDENGTLTGNERYPIYIWAHANGSHADGNFARNDLWNLLKGKSIHFMSWQSINQLVANVSINGELDLSEDENCEGVEANQDLSTIIDLVLAHQHFLKVDPDKIFIGGQSRGSVISWQTFHSRGDEIAGGFFTEALPNKTWLLTDGRDWVNKNSPDLILGYEYDMFTTNSHDPANGQVIMDIYAHYEAIDPDFTANSKMVYSSGERNKKLFSRLASFINGEFGQGGSQIVDMNNISGETDTKDALCDFPEPNNCIELKVEAPSASVNTENVYCSNGLVNVDVDWSNEGNVWDPHFDALNDDSDYCKLRFGKVDASGEFLEAPYLIHAGNEIDETTMHLEIPVDISCDDDVSIGIQAKYIINCFESPWSDKTILSLPQGSCCSAMLNNEAISISEDNSSSIFTQGSTVMFKSNQSQDAIIRIYDIRGQLLVSRQAQLEKGNVPFQTGLSPGIYLVTIESSVGTTSERVVIF